MDAQLCEKKKISQCNGTRIIPGKCQSTGLENSTRPLVFTSASSCRASENFDNSNEN